MPSSLETRLSRHSDALAGVFSHSDVPSLRDALAHSTDPRARRGVRYAFVDVLLVFVAAVLSGAKNGRKTHTSAHSYRHGSVFRRRPHCTGSRHWSTLKRLTRQSAAGLGKFSRDTIATVLERYMPSQLMGKRCAGRNTRRGHAPF